jgi:hypothetical protein
MHATVDLVCGFGVFLLSEAEEEGGGEEGRGGREGGVGEEAEVGVLSGVAPVSVAEAAAGCSSWRRRRGRDGERRGSDGGGGGAGGGASKWSEWGRWRGCVEQRGVERKREEVVREMNDVWPLMDSGEDFNTRYI